MSYITKTTPRMAAFISKLSAVAENPETQIKMKKVYSEIWSYTKNVEVNIALISALKIILIVGASASAGMAGLPADSVFAGLSHLLVDGSLTTILEAIGITLISYPTTRAIIEYRRIKSEEAQDNPEKIKNLKNMTMLLYSSSVTLRALLLSSWILGAHIGWPALQIFAGTGFVGLAALGSYTWAKLEKGDGIEKVNRASAFMPLRCEAIFQN